MLSFSVDALAGHDDYAATGGNSTSGTTATGNLLTTQQAVDLKEAVKHAIASALAVRASLRFAALRLTLRSI